MENHLFNGHLIDLLYMKDNHILGIVNPNDYTYLMATKGSNYQRNELNLMTENTSAAIASVTNFVFFFHVASITSKGSMYTFPKFPTCLVESASEERDENFKAHARNEQPMVDFQLMFENKLNIIMND
jgi:hypothetical protein